jgi:hypothetical protein
MRASLLLVLVFCFPLFCVAEPVASDPQYSFQPAVPGPNPVEEALAALRARTDVTFTTQSGWTIATEGEGLTIWSFTPADHPAHPAYVKRWSFQKDGAWYLDMQVMCGASKAACDKLVSDFQKLNEQMRESIQKSKGH